MRRGEVWWTEQPQPIGRRPVVLLSRDEAYAVRNAVTVAQVTTTIRDIPMEVRIDKKRRLAATMRNKFRYDYHDQKGNSRQKNLFVRLRKNRTD